MHHVLMVGAGGCLGAVARYGVYLGMARWRDFPYATLTVNVVGCLLIGALMALVHEKAQPSEAWRLFLVTGILGGFTTFSAFGYETWVLVSEERWGSVVASVAANLLAGVGAVALGAALLRRLA